MTGERVPAEEAHRIGLVSHIYPGDELLPAAREIAAVMCSKNRFGLRLTKDAFNAALNGSSLEDANRMEDRKGSAHHRERDNGGGRGAGLRQGNSRQARDVTCDCFIAAFMGRVQC